MITVIKDKSEQLPDTESLFVSFNYNPGTVRQIKSLPIRKYDSGTKSWEVPVTAITELIDLFGKDNLYLGEGVELNPKKEQNTGLDFSEAENKIAVFSKYLKFIEDRNIYDLALSCIEQLPEYFFHVPASSSGKYHPKYALGDGGLLRHTQSAMLMAITLFGNDTVQHFTQREKDCILVALCLHDGYKQGDSNGHTTFTHPLAVVDYLETKLPDLVKDVNWLTIKEGIVSHMGQWCKSMYEDTVLPLPKSSIQQFVHLCDYLASRRFINVDLL